MHIVSLFAKTQQCIFVDDSKPKNAKYYCQIIHAKKLRCFAKSIKLEMKVQRGI